MDKTTRIAKQVVLNLARQMIARQEKTYRFSKDCVVINIPKDGWKQFGNKPEWVELVSYIDDHCKGKFYGIDHSCARVYTDGSESVKLTFDGTHNADRKSPQALIENNLKSLGFQKE